MFFFEIWCAHSRCEKTYTYASEVKLPLYSVVSVPFGSSICFGVVISEVSPINNYKKTIVTYDFLLSEFFFEFIKRFSSYYFLNVGAVLELVFPSVSFKKCLPILLLFEGRIHSLSELLERLPLKKIRELSAAPLDYFLKSGCINEEYRSLNIDFLSDDQKTAVNFIKSSKKVCLLEGVTGSGKTVVALESIVNFDKKILILVPEINLANNWVEVIKSHFSIIPFVFHSKMSRSFKKSFFNWAISDSPGFVVGTRSALMIPYKNLDYIIVDEEHSGSYRQDVYPYYNARDMAVLLGNILAIKVLLLSATPALETILNIQKKKYDHFKLTRAPKHGLANVVYIKGSPSKILSSEILNKVSERFRLNQQVLFFLNRKGYVPYCSCNQCKNILICQDCEVAFTLYADFYVVCHKCNKKMFLPKICPHCSLYTTWSFWGLGVQKLHEFLSNLYSKHTFSVLTCDSDDFDLQMDKIKENKVNGIIATQILAQGYDFRNIGMVVVVDADMGLISTDFRAMERIYQLWQQLRGRSGRHDIKGEMILQYFRSCNRFLDLFKKEDVSRFLLEDRIEGGWPPFSKCAFVKFKGRNKRKLCDFVDTIVFRDGNVLGPVFWGVKNRVFEFRFLVKCKDYASLKISLDHIKASFKNAEIEVDPY